MSRFYGCDLQWSMPQILMRAYIQRLVSIDHWNSLRECYNCRVAEQVACFDPSMSSQLLSVPWSSGLALGFKSLEHALLRTWHRWPLQWATVCILLRMYSLLVSVIRRSCERLSVMHEPAGVCWNFGPNSWNSNYPSICKSTPLPLPPKYNARSYTTQRLWNTFDFRVVLQNRHRKPSPSETVIARSWHCKGKTFQF